MTKSEGKQKQKDRRLHKRKVRQTVWIGGDEDLAKELSDARSRVVRLEQLVQVRGEEASDGDHSALSRAKEELEEAEKRAREELTMFVFEAIGEKRYQKLIEEHPPTEEQVNEAAKDGESISFNPDTFPAALVDASCIIPEHEPGEIAEWVFDDPDDEWNQAEKMDLFNAALNVNMSRTRVPMGKGSGSTTR